MKLTNSTAFALVTICILINCDMFSPRTIEKPTSGSTVTDPFQLYTILKNTGYSFSKTSYEDIFDTGFVFIDGNNASFTRTDEIEALKAIVASCGCDSINTAWDTCNGPQEIHADNALTLWRSFKVTFFSGTSATVDSGKAEFNVRRSAENTWTVITWNEGPQRTIFHPK